MPEHVIPWWMGYLLISPIRKLKQNPVSIISPFIKEGYRVLDVGSSMGYFSIPMAGMVGINGKVFCVDAQQQMLNVLTKRAKKYKVEKIIEQHLCPFDSLNIGQLAGTIDFALAFAVVHEVPNKENLFEEVYSSLKPMSKFLFAEPTGHETLDGFNNSVQIAEKTGFKVIEKLNIYNSYSVLFMK